MTTLLSERRDLALAAAGVQLRAPAKDKPEKFYGLASPFGIRAEIGDAKTWGFFEEFMPGCYTDTLAADDQRKLIDHDSYYIVSRCSAGDLLLSQSARGLEVESELDEELSYVRDLKVNIRKKRITGMSIGFRVPVDGDEWLTIEVEQPRADGKIQVYQAELRRIHRTELEEASSVTWPAFVDTSATIRHAIGPALVGRGDAKAISRRAEHHPELAELLKLVDRRSRPIPIPVQGLGSRRTRRPDRRDFDPDQPRDDNGWWTDGGAAIITKTLNFAGKAVTLGAHGGGVTSLSLDGGREVHLDDREVEALRKQASRWTELDLGEAATFQRHEMTATGVYSKLLLHAEKTLAADWDDKITDKFEEPYTRDKYMIRLAPHDDPSYDEIAAADGFELKYHQLENAIESLQLMSVADRIDTGNGTVDMYPDGRNLVLKPEGGKALAFNGKAFRALYKAINDLDNDFEDANGDMPDGPLSPDQTATRTFDSNLGKINLSVAGPDGDLTIDVPDHGTTIVVDDAHQSSFHRQISDMGYAAGALRSARLGSRRAARNGVWRRTGKGTNRWANAMVRRDNNPFQPRDAKGRWSKTGSGLRAAMTELLNEAANFGPDGTVVGAYFGDRDGVEVGRYFEFNTSSHESDEWQLEFGHDGATGTIRMDSRQFADLRDQLALSMLADGDPPTGMTDRQALLLDSLTYHPNESFYVGDDVYFDWSAKNGDTRTLEITDDDGDVSSMDLNGAEVANLHAAISVALMQEDDANVAQIQAALAEAQGRSRRKRSSRGTKHRTQSAAPSNEDAARIMRSYQKRFPHLV